MTYLQFHLVFLLPAILLLLALSRCWKAPAYARRFPFALAAVIVIAFIYTTPWDNYLVYREVWGYSAGRVLGTIGYVPIEEYMFFVLQPVLTGLWVRLLIGRKGIVPDSRAHRRGRWYGAAAGALLTLAGALMLGYDSYLYMGLILVWSGPILAGQWAYAGHVFTRQPFVWSVGVIVPTLYLWVADRVAIGLEIWYISDAYTTGPHLAGLPIEEATFFFVTNLMVVQGLMMFTTPPTGKRRNDVDLESSQTFLAN